jgi:hypothetical protein
MRGIMLTVLLIVALIIGILVIKDMNTKDQTGTANIERIDRAKQATDQANKTINRMKNAAKQAAQTQQAQPAE